jgi:hypothetical protein
VTLCHKTAPQFVTETLKSLLHVAGIGRDLITYVPGNDTGFYSTQRLSYWSLDIILEASANEKIKTDFSLGDGIA